MISTQKIMPIEYHGKYTLDDIVNIVNDLVNAHNEKIDSDSKIISDITQTIIDKIIKENAINDIKPKYTREQYVIMDAFANGAEIEFKQIGNNFIWSGTDQPIWNWNTAEYRIKENCKSKSDIDRIINTIDANNQAKKTEEWYAGRNNRLMQCETELAASHNTADLLYTKNRELEKENIRLNDKVHELKLKMSFLNTVHTDLYNEYTEVLKNSDNTCCQKDKEVVVSQDNILDMYQIKVKQLESELKNFKENSDSNQNIQGLQRKLILKQAEIRVLENIINDKDLTIAEFEKKMQKFKKIDENFDKVVKEDVKKEVSLQAMMIMDIEKERNRWKKEASIASDTIAGLRKTIEDMSMSYVENLPSKYQGLENKDIQIITLENEVAELNKKIKTLMIPPVKESYIPAGTSKTKLAREDYLQKNITLKDDIKEAEVLNYEMKLKAKQIEYDAIHKELSKLKTEEIKYIAKEFPGKEIMIDDADVARELLKK